MSGGRRTRPTVADDILRDDPEGVVGPRRQGDALVVAVTWQLRAGDAPPAGFERRVVLDDELCNGGVVFADQFPVQLRYAVVT